MAAGAPPPGAPPLLTEAQLWDLSNNGYTTLTLPAHIRHQYKGLFDSAADFFKLDQATKSKAFPAVAGDTEQGFTLIPDEKEYLSLRHRVLSDEAASMKSRDFQASMAGLWSETAMLLVRAMIDISHFLHLEPAVWAPLLEDCMSLPGDKKVATPSLFRVFRYDPSTGIAGAHKDLGLLTLCVGQGKGLEVRPAPLPDSDSQEATPGPATPKTFDWHDAGEVTLLVGDTLRILSSRRMQSGLHRVVGNPDGRYSAVFALRMDTRQSINLSDFHPDSEGTVEAADLWQQIKKSRINVNAQKDVRDEQIRRRAGKDVC